MKILLATPEGLRIPVAWLPQAFDHYKLVPSEIVTITLRGNHGKLVDDYQYMSKVPRLMFSGDRIQEMMHYIDGALFIWDGADPIVNNLRNWVHSARKPYIDWMLEAKDHTV